MAMISLEHAIAQKFCRWQVEYFWQFEEQTDAIVIRILAGLLQLLEILGANDQLRGLMPLARVSKAGASFKTSKFVINSMDDNNACGFRDTANGCPRIGLPLQKHAGT